MEKTYCGKERAHALTAQRAKEEVVSLSDIEKACGVFRVLADPTRLKILLALMKGEMCVYHIADVVGGTVSGVSHQLRILRENNIVKATRFGKNIEYSLADKHIEKMVEMGMEHLACAKE